MSDARSRTPDRLWEWGALEKFGPFHENLHSVSVANPYGVNGRGIK